MKLGTSTSVLYLYTIQDAIPIIAKTGYQGVDIWGGRPHVYRRDYSERELLDLKKLIANNGLGVSSFMPAFYRYPHSLTNPNPKVRRDSIAYMIECVDNAAVLQAPIVLVVPDLTLFGQKKEDSRKRLIESLHEISQYSLQYDMKLGIEILYFDETDYINNSDEALSIYKELDQPNIGFVLDTGTINLSKEPPEEIFTTLNKYILQVHVNDNHGKGHQQNLIPGEGTFDFVGFINVLVRFGYKGFISAELSKEYSLDVEPALSTTAQRLKEWMKADQRAAG
jgi:protein FrlC